MRSAGCVLAGLVAVCAACTESAGAPPRPDGLHAEDGALVDGAGLTRVLRGVNMAGSHKFPPFVSDFGEADYQHVADLGFNTLRFLVTWAALEPTRGRYDDAYVAEVEKRIVFAEKAGLEVFVDMHQDLYGVGFAGGDGAPRWACDESRYAGFKPTDPWFFGYLDKNVAACVDELTTKEETVAAFAAAWAHLAERLVSHPNVIGFDVLNEPHWGSFNLLAFEAERLQPFYERVVAAVRKVAPKWLVFMEPGASRNLGTATRLVKPSFDRVVYAPHSYDRDAEQNKPFDLARRQAVLDNMRALAQEAKDLGAALVVGEYGTPSSLAGAADYMAAEYDAMGEVGAGGTYWAWDRGPGYSLLDEQGRDKPIVESVALPFPDRVEGAGLRWRWDRGAKVLSIELTPRGDGRLDVITPARLFPRGAAVDCGGCAVTAGRGRVSLRGVRAGAGDASGRATVTVRPTP
ncbi:MAG: cellulase family glycosylhydrolase [Myxococcales bacterium]|nr:cellulase family glycosylhydrolase [Myxococcales bacterium]